MSRLRSIKGLVAFVTGGASGLGKGTAERLVRHGAKVVIADLPSSAGGRVAEELGHENAFFAHLDVSNPDDVLRALRTSEDYFKRIDALVNCSALGIARAIYNITEKRPNNLDDVERVFQVNITGTFNVMRLGVEFLNKNDPNSDGHRGVIVNTSGFPASDGHQAQAFYGAACGAINSMTLPASRDLAKLGIRVVTISPGVFDTPLVNYLPPEVKACLADQIPSPPRFGHPYEFGHLVQLILENPYVNGEIIRLDGGARYRS